VERDGSSTAPALGLSGDSGRIVRMDAGRAKQLDIWRACGSGRRVELACELIAIALQVRDDRLRRRYPGATDAELAWARVREVLSLPNGTTRP
jgi:hypothetical protein